MTLDMPIRDADAETAVIGCALLVPACIEPLVGEEGLRAEHFYSSTNGAIFDAIVEMNQNGGTADEVAVAGKVAHLGHEATRAIAEAYVAVGDAHAFRHHARRIRDRHHFETMRRAGIMLAEGASMNDTSIIAEAERLLTEPAGTEQTMVTGVQRKERALERFEDTDQRGIPLPWQQLNRLFGGGGMWPGRYVLVGGYTAHGKSAWLDAALEHGAARGKRVAVYLTETTEEERTDRTIARTSRGLTMDQVEQRSHVEEHVRAIRDMPEVTCIEAHDWTVTDITRHIALHRWDLCGVDVLHDIHHRDERDIAEIGRALVQTAKRTRVPMFVAAHLNDNRVTEIPDPPVNRDVRGSGMLVRQADVVLMVWQLEDEDGPTGDGLFRITKNRKGRTGNVKTTFNGARQQWRELTPMETAR